MTISISEAESVVMRVLWQNSPKSSEDIIAALKSVQDWQEATVKTLLNRLLSKRAIAAERDGRKFLYRPILSQDAYLAQQSGSLLDRLFGGQVVPLVAHFSKNQRLSAGDLIALKKLIAQLEHDESESNHESKL
jgi:BlaI family transcriptional regulator, penicillinase repressor